MSGWPQLQEAHEKAKAQLVAEAARLLQSWQRWAAELNEPELAERRAVALGAIHEYLDKEFGTTIEHSGRGIVLHRSRTGEREKPWVVS